MKFCRSALRLMQLCAALLTLCPAIASAAAPTCVVKLTFSSDDKSDSGTDAYVKQVLADEGYKIVDNWLLTILDHADYDVKIVVNHTQVPNYGFPVTLMGMQLYIADGSGTVLLNNYIDRSNLEANLRTWVPACNASPPSAPPNADADVVSK
jgi:hypothetical protein